MKRPAASVAEAPPLDPERLFRRLARARGLVLAVSGGPDSTALMVLVSRWSARPPTLVVTVDHGLRPEAKTEAQLVAENAERLGLPWRIMQAPERPTSGNMQDWARRARYRCLVSAAEEAGFDTIVMAHHQDDQAETLLLRLARGSGVYGLAAMAEEGVIDGRRLVRPLLGVPRARLAEVSGASELATVNDPSNEDLRFDRVRMRALMPALSDHGLTPDRLAGTAGRLRRAAAALDHYAKALIDNDFQVDRFGVCSGSAAPLAEAPEEVALRALALILMAVGGADYTPRLDGIEPILAAILAAEGKAKLKRTLHGVVLSLQEGRLMAGREWGREGIATVTAAAGSTLVWDGRFRVHVPGAADLSVGPLGRSTRRLCSKAVDRTALRTLPGVFSGETLIALPEGVATTDNGAPLGRLAAECLVAERLRLPRAP
jgi:tRNA(Ile)-lysidine synthase